MPHVSQILIQKKSKTEIDEALPPDIYWKQKSKTKIDEALSPDIDRKNPTQRSMRLCHLYPSLNINSKKEPTRRSMRLCHQIFFENKKIQHKDRWGSVTRYLLKKNSNTKVDEALSPISMPHVSQILIQKKIQHKGRWGSVTYIRAFFSQILIRKNNPTQRSMRLCHLYPCLFFPDITDIKRKKDHDNFHFYSFSSKKKTNKDQDHCIFFLIQMEKKSETAILAVFFIRRSNREKNLKPETRLFFLSARWKQKHLTPRILSFFPRGQMKQKSVPLFLMPHQTWKTWSRQIGKMFFTIFQRFIKSGRQLFKRKKTPRGYCDRASWRLGVLQEKSRFARP